MLACSYLLLTVKQSSRHLVPKAAKRVPDGVHYPLEEAAVVSHQLGQVSSVEWEAAVEGLQAVGAVGAVAVAQPRAGPGAGVVAVSRAVEAGVAAAAAALAVATAAIAGKAAIAWEAAVGHGAAEVAWEGHVVWEGAVATQWWDGLGAVGAVPWWPVEARAALCAVAHVLCAVAITWPATRAAHHATGLLLELTSGICRRTNERHNEDGSCHEDATGLASLSHNESQ